MKTKKTKVFLVKCLLTGVALIGSVLSPLAFSPVASADCIEKARTKYDRWLRTAPKLAFYDGQLGTIGLMSTGLVIGAAGAIPLGPALILGGLVNMGGALWYLNQHDRKLQSTAFLLDSVFDSGIAYQNYPDGTCQFVTWRGSLDEVLAKNTEFCGWLQNDSQRMRRGFIQAVQNKNPTLTPQQVLENLASLNEQEAFCPGRRLYSIRRIIKLAAGGASNQVTDHDVHLVVESAW